MTDVIREALRALEENGRLTARDVVTAARDPASPLHDCFEWDDSTAAEAWRTEQARSLIRSVVVNVTVEERTISSVHYVRDPTVGDEQGYVSVPQLRSEPEAAKAMLVVEFQRAEACYKRAMNLTAALGQPGIKIHRTVSDLRKRTARLREKMGDGDGANAPA